MSEHSHGMVSVSTWTTCSIISQKNVYVEGFCCFEKCFSFYQTVLLLQHNGDYDSFCIVLFA